MIPYYDIECLKLELAEGTIAIHFTLFFFPKKFNNKRAIVNEKDERFDSFYFSKL